EERIHPVGLQEAPLDIEHGVVARGFVETDDNRRFGGRGTGHRELHLVAISVDLGRADDRAELEARDVAETLQHVPHLFRLEGELSRIVHVLEAAATAPPEIGTGCRDSVRRGHLDRLDRPATEPRSRLIEPYAYRVSRHAPRYEDHVAVGPADPFPTK